MSPEYSSTVEPLKPATLEPETLIYIGRIVRAFAEIEDLIKFRICNLANISESAATVLLGRATISAKLAMALYLAKMASPAEAALHTRVFNNAFSDAQKCRNAVAHGVLLGETEEGRLTFLTADTVDPTGIASATQIAISYLPEDIAKFAKESEAAIPWLEKNLRLAPWRERRLGRSLLPHRKGLNQAKNSKKPRTPPPPSRG